MQKAATETRPHVATGIALMTLGVFALSINDAFAKALTGLGYLPIQILFIRNLIALPIAAAIAWRMGGAAALRTHKPLPHLVRGAIWVGATIFFFTAVSLLELAEATTLIFIAPVFITALSALLLKEHVGWHRWAAVLVGFAGVLVVTRPGSSTFQAASMLPIGAAFLYAALMISARWVDPRESVWTLMLYLTGAGALISAFAMPVFWVPVRWEDLWLFVGIAAFGTAGITMMTQAFRFAPAAVVAPFDYTALIWATLMGWVFWSEIPDYVTYFGAAIIIASGIYIVWREGRVAKAA